MKTGQCKFGITCKFHHPQPAAAAAAAATATLPPPASAPQFYPSVQQHHSLMPSPPSSSLRPLLPGSFMQGPYAPMLLTPPGVLPIQAWSHYSVPPPSLFFVSSPLYIFFLLTLILSSRHLSALLYLLVLLSKPLLCMELHSSLPPLPGSIHLVVFFRRKRASQRDPVSQSASTI